MIGRRGSYASAAPPKITLSKEILLVCTRRGGYGQNRSEDFCLGQTVPWRGAMLDFPRASYIFVLYARVNYSGQGALLSCALFEHATIII